MTIVNKDIRWGFIGITVNEAWVHNAVSEAYSDNEEYDFDKELDETEEQELRELLNKFVKDLERLHNTGKIQSEITDLTTEMYGEYAWIYAKRCPDCREPC